MVSCSIQKRFEQAAVGIEAGRVKYGVFFFQETRQGAFELLVQILRAADEPNRGKPVAESLQAIRRCLDNGRMIGQAQVIVGAEIDDFCAADANGGALFALKLSFALVEAFGLQVGRVSLAVL